ncbi:MAG TPA: hypothetical protein VGJ55_11380 [Pyrinomonadaceae bacterium]|jgi:hypothetical protein
MTEAEYKRLKEIQDSIAEQQKLFAARTRDAEKRFAPIDKRAAELLAVIKKRIRDRDGGQ